MVQLEHMLIYCSITRCSCTVEPCEREREEDPALELFVPSCKSQIAELLLENRDMRSTTRRACAHVIDEISSYRLRYFSSSDYVSSSFPTDLEHACNETQITRKEERYLARPVPSFTDRYTWLKPSQCLPEARRRMMGRWNYRDILIIRTERITLFSMDYLRTPSDLPTLVARACRPYIENTRHYI